ncbi:MAG: AzlC family ABC transporter permease [Treponema sp.]|nr:AzlC family ABC transporter permease [Spirochaetia bacterium]MDY5124251.1 AzlC family ABC transporter permease [Treponema sp.]
MSKNNKKVFWEGFRDGFPIGLGYFAVAFSLGIVAQNAGLNPIEGFIASFFNVASAGEYALFTSIQAKATYIEIAIITLVVNARYLLMSCALSQRFNPETKFIHRFLVGFGITDEIFGISIARPGYVNPLYNYGAIAISVPLWSLGTSLGIIAGNFLPARVVSALSVALYGMFIAIIVPPAKKNIVIAIAVAVSFVLSYLCTIIPWIKNFSGGTRTIVLTVLISAVVAIIKPIKDEEDENRSKK